MHLALVEKPHHYCTLVAYVPMKLTTIYLCLQTHLVLVVVSWTRLDRAAVVSSSPRTCPLLTRQMKHCCK